MKLLSVPYSKRTSYFVAGLLLMIPVLWIARTQFFHFCYTPLILGALIVSGVFFNEDKIVLPSKLSRSLAFISGMIITEFGYGAILIPGGDEAIKNSWMILSIETLLGIAVFELFFALAIGLKFLKNILRK